MKWLVRELEGTTSARSVIHRTRLGGGSVTLLDSLLRGGRHAGRLRARISSRIPIRVSMLDAYFYAMRLAGVAVACNRSIVSDKSEDIAASPKSRNDDHRRANVDAGSEQAALIPVNQLESTVSRRSITSTTLGDAANVLDQGQAMSTAEASADVAATAASGGHSAISGGRTTVKHGSPVGSVLGSLLQGTRTENKSFVDQFWGKWARTSSQWRMSQPSDLVKVSSHRLPVISVPPDRFACVSMFDAHAQKHDDRSGITGGSTVKGNHRHTMIDPIDPVVVMNRPNNHVSEGDVQWVHAAFTQHSDPTDSSISDRADSGHASSEVTTGVGQFRAMPIVASLGIYVRAGVKREAFAPRFVAASPVCGRQLDHVSDQPLPRLVGEVSRVERGQRGIAKLKTGG